jgi:hypothetical protein
MDCEKLDSVLMDELYGELDDITSAAVRRHVAGCARCAALLSGMRATRRVASLPMVGVPSGLEDRILAAAAAHASPAATLQWRFARAVSLAGNWAMRPQTAMAAVFLVMIGTSVLLLRGRSSRAPASAEMIVTEEGTPVPAASAPGELHGAAPGAVGSAAPRDEGPEKSDKDKGGLFAAPPPAQAVAATPPLGAAPAVAVNAAPAPAAPPAPIAGAEPAPEVARAKALKIAPKMAAADGFDDDQAYLAPTRGLSPTGGAGGGAAAGAAHASGDGFAQAPAAASPAFDAAAELARARSERDDATRRGQPCPSVGRFNEVVNHAGGTAAGWDAVYEGALCYESAGDVASARNRLNVLLRVDAYKDRARARLDELNRRQLPASAPASATKPAAPAAAAPVPSAGPTEAP